MEPDIACLECHKTFPDTTKLKSHKKTHTRKMYLRNLGAAARKINQNNHNGSTSKGMHPKRQVPLTEVPSKSPRRKLCDRLLRTQSQQQGCETDYVSDSQPRGEALGDCRQLKTLRRSCLDVDYSVTDRECLDGDTADERSPSLEQSRTNISLLLKGKSQQTKMDTENGKKCKKSVSKTCKVCGKVFARSANVQLHMRLHRGEKPFTCPTCGKNFRRSDHLKNHELVHVRKEPYECSLCSVRFKRKDHLKYHQINNHGAKIYLNELKSYTRTAQGEVQTKLILCDICGISFGSEKNLKNHLRIHSNYGRFPCSFCGQAFNQSSNLNIHLRKHTGETPYKCFDCDQSFTTSSKLKTHARKHTGDQPFTCEVCGRLFGENHLLKMHMRIHSTQKLYKCSHCSKTFTHSSTLRAHVRTHTGAKPYKCDQCGDSFAQISSLTYHKRTHSGEKPYSCHICGNSYTRMATLNIHLTRHSGLKRVSCSHCDFKCDTPKHLRKHSAKTHGHLQKAGDFVFTRNHSQASGVQHADSFINSPTHAKVSSPEEVNDLCDAATLKDDQTQKQTYQSLTSWSSVPSVSKSEQFHSLSSCTDSPATTDQAEKTAELSPAFTQGHLPAGSTPNTYNPSIMQCVYGLVVGFSDMPHNTGPSIPVLSGSGQIHTIPILSDSSQIQNIPGLPGPNLVQNTPVLSSKLTQFHNSRHCLNESQLDFHKDALCSTANSVSPEMVLSPPYVNILAQNVNTPAQGINNCTHVNSSGDINPHNINTCTLMNPITHIISLPSLCTSPYPGQATRAPNSTCNLLVPDPSPKVNILSRSCLTQSQHISEMAPQAPKNKLRNSLQSTNIPDSCTTAGSQVVQPAEIGQTKYTEKSSLGGVSCDVSEKSSLGGVSCEVSGKSSLGGVSCDVSEKSSLGGVSCDVSERSEFGGWRTGKKTQHGPHKKDNEKNKTSVNDEATTSSLCLGESKKSGHNQIKPVRAVRSKLTSDSKKTTICYTSKLTESNIRITKLRTSKLKSQIHSMTTSSASMKDVCKPAKQLVTRKGHPVECGICGQTFSRAGNLTTHMRLHSGERPYSCKTCERSYTRSDHLKAHMLLHKGNHSLVCNHCGDVFGTTDQLNVHVADRHEGKKPFACNICLFCCLDLRELKEHVKGHVEQDSFICDLCQVSFPKVRHLKKHMKSHDRLSAFSCRTCGKSFKESSCLKLHTMTKHTGEKHFKCGICEETYVTAAKLQRHMCSHSGTRPFACEFCGKMFIDTCLLKMHVRIHTKEKPFKCKHCEQSFTHRSTLRAHIRTHTGIKPYTCEVCGASFAQVSSLMYHKRRHDGVKPYTCHICGNSYTRSTTLNIHMTRHTGQKRVSCPHCVFKCDVPKHLRKHLAKFHSRPGLVSSQHQGTEQRKEEANPELNQHEQQHTTAKHDQVEPHKQLHHLHAPQILLLPHIPHHLQQGFMLAESFQQPHDQEHQNVIIHQPQEHPHLPSQHPHPPSQQLHPHPHPLVQHQPIYKSMPEAYTIVSASSSQFATAKFFSQSTPVNHTY